jgi:hypothetical protein
LAEKRIKISFFNNEKNAATSLSEIAAFLTDLQQKLDYAFLLGENKCLYQKNIKLLVGCSNDKMEFTSLLMMSYSCDYRLGFK